MTNKMPCLPSTYYWTVVQEVIKKLRLVALKKVLPLAHSTRALLAHKQG